MFTTSSLLSCIPEDKITTTKKLGFKVIGYVIKSRDKEVEEKFYKFPYKKEHEI